MVKYFLIGGKEDDLKSNYIEKQLLTLVNKIKVNILYFPTAMKDSEKSINHFIHTFDKLSVNITVCKLLTNSYTFEELDNLFNNTDIIYVGGGNTDFLRETFIKHKIDLLLNKYKDSNKIYAGISAGAIIYCDYGMGDSYSYIDNNHIYNFKMVEGLHLINTIICPHYNKEDLYIFNDETKDKKLSFALEDDTALLLVDNKVYSYIANTKHSVYKFEYGRMEKISELSKIHVLGLNTYSYFAALKHRTLNNIYNPIVEHSSIRKVVESIKNCDFAIVPIENSLDGYVSETLDLLYEFDLEIINELKLKISFSLVSYTSIENIEKVYVQFKAKGQCVNYLDNLNKPLIETDSNIESLNLLNETRKNFAAIVPTYMTLSDNFNTKVIDVCDKTNNYTRFVVLKKTTNETKQELNKEACSFILIPSVDEVGILYSMLKMFNDYKINLNAIMSRPTKEGLGKYYFYVEFSLNNTGNLKEMLDNYTLSKKYIIKNLGEYSKEGD